MPWVRIDEEFPEHPKVLAAGPLGMAMQVAALCYCNRHLTDGFIPRAIVPGLLNLEGLGMRMWMGELTGGGEDATWRLVVDDLKAAGLWEQVQGGWRIHDYHDYQPSREHVLAIRKVRQEVGAKGGRAKRKQVANQLAEQTPSNDEAKTEAKMNPVPVTPSVVQVVPDAEPRGGLTLVDSGKPNRPASVTEIHDIFDAWKATLPPGSRHELTDARRDAIRSARKRYPFEDVLDAVRGWPNDPWPDRAQQNDIPQLLWTGTKRKPANILEKMRDLYRHGPPAQLGKRTQQMVATYEQMRTYGVENGLMHDGNGLGTMAGDRRPPQRELARPAD
jgi:hypothetical protein